MRQRPNVLIIGDDDERMGRLRAILRRTSRVEQADDLPQALQQLAAADYEAVFVDWRFHCGTWREALRLITALYSDLPVIVISQTDGTEQGIQEWVEVLEAGAFDLLLSVHNEFATLSLLEQAVASSEARALRATA